MPVEGDTLKLLKAILGLYNPKGGVHRLARSLG